MESKTSRRSFIRSSAFAGIAASLSLNAASANDHAESSIDQFENSRGLVFLFQGDSITDGNRGRNNDPNHIMGHSYAFSIASRVGADFPTAGNSFYNRGISGNQVIDLRNRWQEDTLNINPDVLSVLIGINDASALINKPIVEEAAIDQFEITYRDILTQSKKLNPEILFVICLPFVYPVARVKEHWEKYRTTVARLTERIKKLAAEFNAIIVDFPAAIDKVIKKAPVDYWIWDGIHPTVPAHEVLAREWIKQVSSRLKFLRVYKYK